jgi:hypothetical protein
MGVSEDGGIHIDGINQASLLGLKELHISEFSGR